MRPITTGSTSMRRTVRYLGLAAVLVLAAGSCAQKYSAERDGKDLGQALCDLRGATSAEEAGSALSEVQEELDELASNYSMFTAEDRADIDEQLNDLAEHIAQGNEVLIQQDLAVMRRSISNIRGDVDDTSEAAWDGVLQGLDDCIPG